MPNRPRPETSLRVEFLEDRSCPSTFTVTNTNDSGAGSLRAEIALATADGNADVIDFAPSMVGATLPLSTIGNESVGASALAITTAITIQGSGQTLTRSAAAPAMRLFLVEGGGNLTLEDLWLRNGDAAGQSGIDGAGGPGMGGAIFNQGTLNINESTLSGNQAAGGVAVTNGGSGAQTGGGGGFTSGGGQGTFAGSFALTQTRVAFTGGGGSDLVNIEPDANLPADILAPSGNGVGGNALGGAIFNSGGTVVITNSTLSGNAANGGLGNLAGGAAGGGAIFNIDGAVTLINDTLAGNLVNGGGGTTAGSADGGAVYNLSEFDDLPQIAALVTTANTILATSTGDVISGTTFIFDGSFPQTDVYNNQVNGTATINASGPNIVSMAAVNLGGTLSGTAFTIANPHLAPLHNNGGSTPTLALEPGSPAIDAGSNSAATGLATDQRGGARVFNNTVDIGAFELQPGVSGPKPAPLIVSGPFDGRAVVLSADASGQYATSPSAAINVFANLAVDVRTATADVNGDGTPDIIVVTGPGTPIRVAVVSGADDATLLVAPFDPFGGDFLGGGFVAAGAITKDGRAEFVVTPDQGGGPRVSIFELTPGGLSEVANFFGISDPNFRGGARAAIGDLDGDGTPDLIVAAGFGGGPRVAIFNGTTLLSSNPTKMLNDFFAFPEEGAADLRNGVFVAASDINGDGFADLIIGAGPGGGPRVFILSGQELAAGFLNQAQTSPLGNYFAGADSVSRGGVRVASVDADGDDRADLAIGSGDGDAESVRIYLGKNITSAGEPTSQQLTPFGTDSLADGVFPG